MRTAEKRTAVCPWFEAAGRACMCLPEKQRHHGLTDGVCKDSAWRLLWVRPSPGQQ